MTNHADKQYLELAKRIIETGNKKQDRTGVGTLSIFGAQMRFDLNEGFPILTTKKVHFPSVVKELLWFISGDTNNKTLQEQGVRIWNEWATKEQCAKFGRKEGDLGPVYGHQWRNFGASKKKVFNPETKDLEWVYDDDGIDQLSKVINDIKTNPNSRRLIVSGWNPKEADLVCLPPCHTVFQFYVHDGKLSCHLYQRSGDFFLGIPFNIASYALLTHMIAQVCDLGVGEFVHTISDAHVYSNHLDAFAEQMKREPYSLPKIVLNGNVKSLFEFKYEDIQLEGYQHHPAIKAEVAV